MRKFLIILSVIFFVVLLAGELYVQSDIVARWLRPYVVGPLQDVLGPGAQIGWVRANLIPLYIEARDISIPDDTGRQAAAIRKIKVYINPLPLLLKKIHLPSIVLLEPRIYVERTKDGAVSLVPVLDRIKSNINAVHPRGPSGFSVLLRTISVNQARISFKDHMSSTQVTISGLHAVGRSNLAGDSVNITVKNCEFAAKAPAYPELSGDLKGSVWYDHGRFHLESVALRTGDSSIFLSGTVGTLPDPELNLQVKARSGPLTIGKFTNLLKHLKKERKSRFEASASVRGRLTNPTVDGVFQLAGISYEGLSLQDAQLSFSYRDTQLNINGENWKVARGGKSIVVKSIASTFGYSARGLDIQRCELQAADLSIIMSGRADPQRGFDSVLSIESREKGETLSLLSSVPLEGRISIKGYLTGAFNAPLFDGNFSAGPFTVRGILFDDAAGRIQYVDRKLSLVSVDIHQKASRYVFNGSLDLKAKEPVFAARAKVIRSDVTSIVAIFYSKPLPLHLSATGDLSFNGTTHDFTGTGRLALDAGTAYGESFTRGTVVALLTTDRIAFPQVTVEKGSGTVKGSGWIGFDRTYSASIESHGVRLGEVNLLSGTQFDGAFDLAIESSGSFSLPLVSASLEVDDFLVRQTAFGGLSAELNISDRVLTCGAELADKRAGITAKLGLEKPYPWNVQAKMNFDSLDPFPVVGKSDLSGRVTMSMAGKISAHGKGFSDISNVAGSASFQRLAFSVGDYRIENNGAAVMSIDGNRVSITSLNLSGQATKMTVTGEARLLRDIDLSITGVADLSLLRPLFRDLEYTGGTAEVKLTITDNWKNPDVDGELEIRDGEIKIKDIPQKFSGLTGKLTFDQSRVVVDTLTGKMGGGTLSASGKAQLSGLALRDFSTRVVFDNTTVRYPEGLTSTLSGELYYDGDASQQSLTGDVQIKRARYDKRVEWKSMLVDIARGLYQKKKTEAGWVGDTRINIRFYGTDNILFQNNLAKMPLDIDAFLRGTVNRLQLLGRVEARKGSVYFRQNEFRILHGSADFVDPNRINPVLDIQAEIQVREYLIRLAVSGTADRAVVTFLSDPPLPDSEILALLALGKTGTELKGKEAGVGMSEAASFATGQFQDMFESRARSLTGLDRFQVDPYVSKGDTSVPRVTVGKEIVQEKLYVTYSSNVGATTPEQIFRIEYILNKHFSVVGERNELGNTGADIKYRFEFK